MVTNYLVNVPFRILIDCWLTLFCYYLFDVFTSAAVVM